MDRQLWNGFIMTQKEKFLKIFLLFFLCAYIICQVAQTRLVDRAHLVQVTRNKSLPHPHVRLMELPASLVCYYAITKIDFLFFKISDIKMRILRESAKQSYSLQGVIE